MATRWTAPQTGWYRMASGREPEFLGTEPPAETETAGTVTVVHLDTDTIIMNSGSLPSAPDDGALKIRWDES